MKTISANATGIIVKYDRRRKSVYMRYDTLLQPIIETPNQPVSQSFNPLQEIMIMRTERGLNFYTRQELSHLPVDIQSEITRNDEKSKLALRKLKINTFYQAENRLLNVIFPHVNLGSKLTDYYVSCEEAVRMTTDQLRITKENIAKAFIDCGLLPRNFYAIKPETILLSL